MTISPKRWKGIQEKYPLLQRFYNLPIRQKQLIGLFTSGAISIVGLVGVGTYLIVTGGRHQLIQQAKSELAVTAIQYDIKINQMGYGFRGQSDNAAVIAAAQAQTNGQRLNPGLRQQVRQILQNEVKAREIEYATLVGRDLKIIANANVDRTGEGFNPNNLVREVLANPQQIKTSELVPWSELAREAPPLPAGFAGQDALIRYTATPVRDRKTQAVLGVLISGDIVNRKPAIVQHTVETLSGGYSAVYLRRLSGELVLVAAMEEDRLAPPDVDSVSEPIHPALVNESLLQAAVAARGAIVTGRDRIGATTYTIAVKALLNHADEPIALLVRGTPEAALNFLLSQSLSTQFVIALLVLAANIGLAILLSCAIVEPTRRLQQTAQQFAAGDFQARATVFALDEVGQLTLTFNEMADSLAKNFRLEAQAEEQKQLNAQLQQEIAERQWAEASLHRSNAFLKALPEASLDGILVVDEQNQVVLYNQQFHQIWQIPEALVQQGDDRKILDLVVSQPQYPEAFIAQVEYLYQHPELVSRDEILLKDGRVLDRYTTAVVAPDGHYYGRVWYFRDISDRKQAELALQQSEAHLRSQTQQLQQTLTDLRKAQTQLVQSEKMSSLGQLVAGIAHEINNPVNFIHGNLSYAQEYMEELLDLVHLYETHYPDPATAIQAKAEDIDWEFMQEDLPKMMRSMRVGTERIRQIVLSLRNFSRMDEAEFKAVDIHEGIDNTLLLLQHQLKDKPGRAAIQVMKDYGNLPLVECYAGQLNQVFMNILTNAIDALDECSANHDKSDRRAQPNRITIRTSVIHEDWIEVAIADNGVGMPESVQHRIFDPFFTTKPHGTGTGMGMSISYQIITDKHHGKLECSSQPGLGTEFLIQIPCHQPK